MNKWIGSGRLTKNPDVRYTQGENAMCIARYTLAVDRRGKRNDQQQNTDFISCVAMGKNGEFAEKYLTKGTKIMVEGRIQTGSYKNKDGQTVYTTDVMVENHEFCESRGQQSTQPTSKPNDEEFMNIPDDIDEEIPFN